jgi:uncharacterized protein (TIGR02996 family)
VTHEDAFLQAIREAPDDDTPRLVFADWLDDHGQVDRAEFIRVGCTLARAQPGSPEQGQLQQRSAELVRMHTETWFGPLLHHFKDRSQIERGFLVALRGSIDEVLAQAGAIETFAPVLRSLSVDFWRGRAGPEALLEMDFVRRVRNLQLETPTDEQFAFIARADAFGPLERFALLDAQLKQNEDVVLLLNDSPLVAAAGRFDLSFGLFLYNEETPDVDMELVAPRNLRVLNELRLPNLEGFGFWGPTVALAEQMAVLPWFGRLDWLNFHCSFMSDEPLEMLLSSPNLGELTRLSLGENDLTDAGAETIAACAKLHRLRELELEWNQIGEAGGLALASSPHLPDELRLAISFNHLGKEARAQLRKRFGDRLVDTRQY